MAVRSRVLVQYVPESANALRFLIFPPSIPLSISNNIAHQDRVIRIPGGEMDATRDRTETLTHAGVI